MSGERLRIKQLQSRVSRAQVLTVPSVNASGGEGTDLRAVDTTPAQPLMQCLIEERLVDAAIALAERDREESEAA